MIWPLETGGESIFANQFEYTTVGDELIVISFGTYLPTGFKGHSPDEIDEFLSNAVVEPVARIVMTRTDFQSFYELLKGFIEYKEKQAEDDRDNHQQ